MKIKRMILLILVITTISFLLSGCVYFLPTEKSIYKPDLEKSEKIILPSVGVIVGDLRIVYDKEAEVTADIAKTESIECNILGEIDQLKVIIGEQVKKGQLVAVLNLDKINENVYIQEISVEKAQMTYDRDLVLYNMGKVDYYTLEFARLSLESLKNYLNDLYDELKEHYIYATTDGMVVDIFKNEGEQSKGIVMSVCPKENYLLTYQIPPSDNISTTDMIFLKIKSGVENDSEQLDIIYEGDSYKGYLYRNSYEYSLAYNYFGNTTYGQVAFKDIPKNIASGKKVTIRYVEDEVFNAIIIPVSTVFKNDDGSYYTHVVVNNKMEYRNIEVGITDGVFYEVTKGLVQGERVLKSR